MSPIQCQTDGDVYCPFLFMERGKNYAENKTGIFIFYCNNSVDDGVWNDAV